MNCVNACVVMVLFFYLFFVCLYNKCNHSIATSLNTFEVKNQKAHSTSPLITFIIKETIMKKTLFYGNL